MIICFDCNVTTKAALDALIDSEHYQDYSDVIASAIANLLVLRNKVREKGAIVLGDNIELLEKPADSLETPAMGSGANATLISRKSADKVARTHGSIDGIPQIFRLDGISKRAPVLAKPPPDQLKAGSKIRLDSWIFGQYNKLLPAKVSCRGLAHLIGESQRGLLLQTAATRISEQAAALGDYLTNHDSRHGLGRGDALHAGFPHTTVNADGVRVRNNGQLRYANQFVAGQSGKGIVSGLLIDFKLINYSGADPHLQLTEAGWRFALLKNPILDDEQENPAQKFSNDEIEFLLAHIRKSVPAEHFAYRTLLSAIREGAGTPDKLDSALQDMDIWWRNRDRTATTSFLTSQRSGAISRMADLGLVERERKGIRVTYRLTVSGSSFLKIDMKKKH